MTREDFDILISDRGRQAVEQFLNDDPSTVAMRLQKIFGRGAAAIATQIKYLHRAREKFPRLYEARCIIEPLAFEQSSSGSVASTKEYGGALCIDLTCGLGIDTMNFAGHFDKVISIEIDSLRCEIARYNLSLLGIDNVEVVCNDAYSFICSYVERGLPRADMIYVDPARRDSNGKKVFRLTDCSPDVTAILPKAEAIADRLVVKCSPLFEISEVFEVFGKRGVRAEVVSSHNECKEVVVDIEFARSSGPQIDVRSTELGILSFGTESEPLSLVEFTPPYDYLLVPDVAIYKARKAREYICGVAPGAFVGSQSGYGFSNCCPEEFFGRIFEIESMEPLQLKGMKRRFSEQGIKGITVMVRESRISKSEFMQRTALVDGDQVLVALTDIKQNSYIVFLRKKQ